MQTYLNISYLCFMHYIVWREPFESYDIPQGGYFVKYKDKLSDHFSPKWFEASKFSSLGGAITRLGIYGNNSSSLEDFIKSNISEKASKRNHNITKILGNVDISTVISWNGRIDKIDADGNFIGSAEKEVIEYIERKFTKNKKSQRGRSIVSKEPEIDYTSKEHQDDFDAFIGI